MDETPGSVLFACTLNAIRSPMAEAIMKLLHGTRIYVDSVGVRSGTVDGFAVAVMDEIGGDLSRHRCKTFDELDDAYFDLVVSLSPEAQHRAVELTRASAVELEFWHMPDPSLIEGGREQRLDGYRELRQLLMARIRSRFPPASGPTL